MKDNSKSGTEWFEGKIEEIEFPANTVTESMMGGHVLDYEKKSIIANNALIQFALDNPDNDYAKMKVKHLVNMNMYIAWLNGIHYGMQLINSAMPEYRQYILDKFAHNHKLNETEFMSYEEWKEKQERGENEN